jgi:hypothetical protein
MPNKAQHTVYFVRWTRCCAELVGRTRLRYAACICQVFIQRTVNASACVGWAESAHELARIGHAFSIKILYLVGK